MIIAGALPGLCACGRQERGRTAEPPAATPATGTATNAVDEAAPAEAPPPSGPVVAGGVTFENPFLTMTASHADSEAKAVFKFRVTGSRPVTFTDIRTYCSCLSAGTAGGKMTWQPGESGTVEAVFELGAFEGEVRKTLGVTTDEPGAGETILTLAVTIPVLYEVEPSMLKWTLHDPAAAKEFTLRVKGDSAVRVTGLVSSRENMIAEAKEIAPGREYRIILTPRTTAEPMLGSLRVETDAPWERYRRKLLFFSVARPGPAVKGGQMP